MASERKRERERTRKERGGEARQNKYQAKQYGESTSRKQQRQVAKQQQGRRIQTTIEVLAVRKKEKKKGVN